MKKGKLLAGLALCVVILPAASGCSLFNGGAKASTATPWAHVNGHAITGKAVMTRVNLMKLLDPKSSPTMQGKRLRTAVTNRMVEEYLLLQEAQQAKITPPQKEVQAEETTLAKELSGTIYPNKKALQSAMQKLGVSQKDLNTYISDVITINVLLKQKVTVPPVTDGAVKAYYQQYKAQFQAPEEYDVRHILVKTKALAQNIESQLQKDHGKNFAALAKQYSIDTASAKKGGDLGYAPLSQYVTPFSDAVKKLKKGQISGIVQSQYGYHIIELLGTKPGHQLTLKQATPQIRPLLTQQEQQKAVSSYMAKMESKAHISVAVPNNA